MSFTIYNEISQAIWTESHPTIQVNDGLFNVILGSQTALPNTVFEGYERYLGITVEDDIEITPRTRFVSVPYSCRAIIADSAIATQPDNDWAVSNEIIDDIYHEHGNVGIGLEPSSFASLHIDKENENCIDTNVYGFLSDIRKHCDGNVYGVSTSSELLNWNTLGVDSVFGVYGVSIAETTGHPYGPMTYGVYGHAIGGRLAHGVYGKAEGAADFNYAGYFAGSVNVEGQLTKGSGAFKIDHPLDPENKYLQHSFVESPDMMNIYNGIIITDENGLAVVLMPDYFEALNMEFRYQLTVIGDFAQAIIGEKIKNGKFTIRTDEPNIEVSWQVTGIRQDPWANAHRIEVEVDKPESERGYYIAPELYGYGKEKGINFRLYGDHEDK